MSTVARTNKNKRTKNRKSKVLVGLILLALILTVVLMRQTTHHSIDDSKLDVPAKQINRDGTIPTVK
jgi:fumarate reductase subunit D